MGSWGRELQTRGKVRMFGDGNAEFSKAVGLTLDLTARGMGVRSNRYAMLVDNGIVKALHVEEPGKFEVSSAEAMLAKL
jgi:peroxiredoxin